MLYAKPYRNFINGRYFSEGLRMTAGIALPAFIFGYFDMLGAGVALSTGALCVSVTDSAGPIHHRANGMFLCNFIVALTAILTYGCLYSVITTSAEILLLGFVFSMLSVYNARVSSVGISALLIMILCMQTPLQGTDIFIHAFYLFIGGLWYTLFSLLLNALKPYKIIQQLSGEFITGVAEYLRTRASFYDDHPDYEAVYKTLLQQQVKIQLQQSALSELLFKTRAITRNSTKEARSLLKIYLDVSDLFESIMSVYQKYDVLHKKFDETGILGEYRNQLLALSEELAEIGDAVGAGNASVSTDSNKQSLLRVREKFEVLRKSFMSDKNVEDFIGLGRIYNNIQGLTDKIAGLHYYTRFEKSQRNDDIENDLQKFNEAQTIDAIPFLNNLNANSSIFRHALRVAISLFAGFLISLFFNIGHSYWILLTIVVILKPAYSLTKSRNADRLFGTLIGIFGGVGILFAVKSNFFLLTIMVIFMALAYMFIRTKYFISVLFMTIYLVIFFHLIYPGTITAVLKDRLIDTGIGSAIAFLSSLFFVPLWEHTGIRKLMTDSLQRSIEYYKCLSSNFNGGSPSANDDIKRSRQSSLTALANLSDAFNRMLSEPKRFQKNTESIYRFVVLNHILNSHFAALAFYISENKKIFQSEIFLPVIKKTNEQFEAAIWLLEMNENVAVPDSNGILSQLHEQTGELLAQRRAEISAGNLETDIKKKLISAKSVTDQFTYIFNLSGDILKNANELSLNSER